MYRACCILGPHATEAIKQLLKISEVSKRLLLSTSSIAFEKGLHCSDIGEVIPVSESAYHSMASLTA
jgi:hypothetical protein